MLSNPVMLRGLPFVDSNLYAMIDLDNYKFLLRQLKEHLAKYGVRDWPSRISDCISELEVLERRASNKSAISDHVLRTKRALGGMGSIGDIFICAQAGHAIRDDTRERQKANDELNQIEDALFEETTRLLQNL